MDVRNVAVAGTGQMGPGIAAVFALAGCKAVIVGRKRETGEQGVASAVASIEKLRLN